MKTIEQSFRDWESSAFGYGYGTGEKPVLEAVATFLQMAQIMRVSGSRSYDYRELDRALGSATVWLLINRLAQCNVIEYGVSPRFGWLTTEGKRLAEFFHGKTVDELVALAQSEDGERCYPDACNCGPDGYIEGRVCQNPFWLGRVK